MSVITGNFSLTGTIAGQSDPVAINIADYGFDMDNPSVTSGTGTLAAGSKVLIENAAGVGVDYYVYIRNLGTDGLFTGTGKLVVSDEHSSAVRQISVLEVGDFIFLPVIGSAADGGIQLTYNTAACNYTYAYFKRI
jgi:hypothetical protein